MRIAFLAFFVCLTAIGSLAIIKGNRVARFFLTDSVADAFVKKHGDKKLKYAMRCVGLLFIILGIYFLSRQ